MHADHAPTDAPDLGVVFLADDCGPCRDLARALAGSAELIPGFSSRLVAVLMAGGERPSEVEQTLSRADITTIRDDGSLKEACDVRGTPMMLAVDAHSHIATEYSHGSDEQWLISRTTGTVLKLSPSPISERMVT